MKHRSTILNQQDDKIQDLTLSIENREFVEIEADTIDIPDIKSPTFRMTVDYKCRVRTTKKCSWYKKLMGCLSSLKSPKK